MARREVSGALLAAAFATLPVALAAQGPADTILVFVGADLGSALPELAARYQARSGSVVLAVYGSNRSLTSQIEFGAPADLFLTADGERLAALVARKRVVPGSVTPYARDRIVLATTRGPGRPAAHLRDLLQGEFRRIGIADPADAAYGDASQRALIGAGLWDRLGGKLVQGESTRDVALYLHLGAVEAGLLPSSAPRDAGLRYLAIDTTLYRPLELAGAVVAGSRHSRQAADFLVFLSSGEGLAVLARHDYLPPSAD